MLRRCTWTGGWLGSCLLLAGCAFGDAARDAVTVRDSAGVRIVESARPQLPPGTWTLSAEPVLSIGTVEGDPNLELEYVSAAIGLRGGGVLLADRHEPLLRWYDAAGAFVHGAGRRGGGPAEFQYGSPRALWVLPGDSVAAWEVAQPPRVKVYGPGGAYVRSFPTELSGALEAMDGLEVVGATSSGFVTRLYHYSGSREQGVLGEITRDITVFFGNRADGSLAGVIARRPGDQTYLEEHENPGGRPPLRVRASFPFALQPVSRAGGDHLYYGSGDRYEIEVYRLDGTLVRLLRKPVARRAVTGAVRDAWAADFLASSPTPEAKRGRQRTVGALPFPDSLPAFRRMRVDSEGLLWVADYDVPGEAAASWSVFDAEGRWLTDVSLPTSWRIFEIGADYVLVLVTDKLDVQYVQKFALARGVNR